MIDWNVQGNRDLLNAIVSKALTAMYTSDMMGMFKPETAFDLLIEAGFSPRIERDSDGIEWIICVLPGGDTYKRRW